MFLIDTNVISEARRGPRANFGVCDFFRAADAGETFLAAITLGELRRGVEKVGFLGDVSQAQLLTQWLESVEHNFVGRILPFDVDCAHVWGRLMVPHPQHPIDKQIAAIALIHDLTVVTRNTADFDGTGVKLLNPFLA
ncbi:MAG: type II toxin-antitoxin system VapC family toxin [Rhodocyclaceae bacterium]|nr:type II toxin-antitoxin system VapC family toxin [Rhodocyclaceae bacterium]MDZ4213533.1 type II toxin-antitoxin system VapC family toxin [Rhodocyclaceae bacterium]